MMDKSSLFKILGWPESFTVVLLIFTFILLLAPYFSGADFGVFKIPTFTPSAKRWLKFIGPFLFIICASSFIPIFPAGDFGQSRHAETNANVRVAATPTPVQQIEDFDNHWEGTVGGEKVSMMLRRKGDSLEGEIFNIYTKNFNIRIKGSVNKQQEFILGEYDNTNNLTGWYEGQFISQNEIKGDWLNPNKTLSKPFSLKVK
jgi:hypothetical protein